MAFRDRVAANAASSTTSDDTAEAVAEVVQPEQVDQPVAAAANAPVALFGLEPVSLLEGMQAALSVNESGGGLMFPIVKQSGSPSARGMFAPINGTPDDIKDLLPNGPAAFKGMLLGYRWSYNAFKWGYEKEPDGTPADEVKKPAYSFSLPATAGVDIKLANSACKVYKTTKAVDRGIFDFPTSQKGHLTPALELLVYLPAVNDVVVVSSPNTLDGALFAQSKLLSLIDPATGRLPRAAIKVSPEQVTTRSGFQYWAPNIAKVEDNELLAAFNNWATAVQGDEELVEKVGTWLSATDRPISEEHRSFLRNF